MSASGRKPSTKEKGSYHTGGAGPCRSGCRASAEGNPEQKAGIFVVGHDRGEGCRKRDWFTRCGRRCWVSSDRIGPLEDMTLWGGAKYRDITLEPKITE